MTVHEDTEIKSVQSQCDGAPTLSQNVSSLNVAEVRANEAVTVHEDTEIKSVQSPCNDAPTLSQNVSSLNVAKVRANEAVTVREDTEIKSVQSPCKINDSANEQISLKNDPQYSNRFIVVASSKLKQKEDMELIPKVSYHTLNGANKTILDFVYDQCIWSKSLETLPITKANLKAVTGLKEETIISAIKRLRNLNCIDRVEYKDGKSGWTRYALAEQTYNEILYFKSSSRRSVSNQKPIKLDVAEEVLPKLWEISEFYKLDFSALSSLFKASDLFPNVVVGLQRKLSLRQIQDFIERYPTWLVDEKKKRVMTGKPIASEVAFFCSNIKTYAEHKYSPVLEFPTLNEYYKLLEEKVLEQNLAISTEQEQSLKEAEIALAKKAIFESWKEKATKEDCLEILQPKEFMAFGTVMYFKALEGAYFERFPFVT